MSIGEMVNRIKGNREREVCVVDRDGDYKVRFRFIKESEYKRERSVR